MLLALTGYETALLVVAAVFIAFALIVALVVPRSRPDFPSRRLGVFLAVCIAFFAAQMTAVLLLAEVGEAEEVAHEETAGTETPETETGATETTATETTGTEATETEATETDATDTEATETEPDKSEGDPVAGKDVFAAAGCASCHTLADSGATGTVGPNLDATSPSDDKVIERVTDGQGVMPSFKDTLSEQQIQDVAAYVSSVAGS